MIRSLSLLALLVPGLALAWKPVEAGKPVSPGKGVFAVQLPAGWLYDTSSNSVLASHDGTVLDQITILITPHAKAFKAAKKPSSPTALPEDLAESYVENLQADQGAVRDVTLLSTEPAELAGRPAFRVHLKFRAPDNQGGAVIEMTTLGTALESGLLLAVYRAPSIHYFERRLGEFDAAAKTITLVGAPQPK